LLLSGARISAVGALLLSGCKYIRVSTFVMVEGQVRSLYRWQDARFSCYLQKSWCKDDRVSIVARIREYPWLNRLGGSPSAVTSLQEYPSSLLMSVRIKSRISTAIRRQ
jgi:hypothetical protein